MQLKHLQNSIIALAILCCMATVAPLQAQNQPTRADSLRGSLRTERNWFDVMHYGLHIEVNPDTKTIRGFNDIRFKTLQQSNNNKQPRMQLDLFQNMEIEKVEMLGKELPYTREHNAFFIEMPTTFKVGSEAVVRVYYSGKPIIAKKAPWDGGFVWKKSESGLPWVGVACQGLGASAWWPNKDHQSDEPNEGMTISISVPSNLVAVSNGNMVGKQPAQKEGYTNYNWRVTYPINNYDVSINIGDYRHFSDQFISPVDGDTLALDYYVLTENYQKAQKHFEQVKPMMNCFEQYLGKYPFYNDGFALIETPYLGMEHQSGIAYGNNYRTGYNGSDYSRIGLDFDYIIIHETGHEWWGNSITTADIADLWVHEGFCTYSEALYVECMHNYETAMQYINAKKPSVSNKKRIIGTYGLNQRGAGDMYSKGMLLLNTIRHITNNDELWFSIIKGLTQDYKHSIVTSQQVENYINKRIPNYDLSPVFNQYLRHSNIPELQLKIRKKGRHTQIQYRWEADVENFDMPIAYYNKTGQRIAIQPTTQWSTIIIKKTKPHEISFDEQSYYYKINANNQK